MAQHVRVSPGDPYAGGSGETPQAAGSRMAVHPGTAAVEQDRVTRARAYCLIDGAPDGGRVQDTAAAPYPRKWTRKPDRLARISESLGLGVKPLLAALAALVFLPVSLGKSIRLYLADGTPGGLLTAEIMNWTGHVVAAPRSDLAGLLRRPEASRTGIYLLLGDDPDSLGGSLAYIGEGDDVGKRLYQHARAEDQGGKDFWDRAIMLTSKDANLTKAHARYLESRFITLASQARRSRLINGTAPAPLPLPEADVSQQPLESGRCVHTPATEDRRNRHDLSAALRSSCTIT